jgi:hypothetical protein
MFLPDLGRKVPAGYFVMDLTGLLENGGDHRDDEPDERPNKYNGEGNKGNSHED